MEKKKVTYVITVVELLLAVAAILLDLFIPTLVILAIMVVSLVIRKERISSLGFSKPSKPLRLALTILSLSLCWTLFVIGLVMPILNHMTGNTQDLSTFENLKGNAGQLVFLLAASWILAALGEEIAFRGFMQKRISNLFGATKAGLIISVGLSSILFGLIHTEQGIIGVTVTTLDAVFFIILKQRYRNLWAPVLAHGFNNSMGIIAFFFVGPIYGLW